MTVQIVRPHLRYQEQFIDSVRASRALHQSWVFPPVSQLAYAGYVRRCRRRDYEGHLIIAGDGGLVGVVNIGEIVMGGLCSGYMGYYAFSAYARKGLMTKGLHLVLDRAFKVLDLHRIEANIQPDNAPSLALIRRCGFIKEGFSPRYLKVDGQWRDHERWALTLEDYRPPNGSVAL